jgi:nucleoside-diphosphate-sugar epimerase
MMAERIFVTGGSGFLGRELIERLKAEGAEVRALARSVKAERAVRSAGAKVVRGDISELSAMTEGMRGCDAVVHAAALADDWGDPAQFYAVNVEGTKTVIQAARDAGVRRLTHVSTEAVLLDGNPLHLVAEDAPLPERAIGLYPESKRQAEVLALAASSPELAVMVVRPRLIWGHGDTTLMPILRVMVAEGRFRWVGGGHHLTSTCHVRNCCEGLLLATRVGKGGEIYHLTDGDPLEFRTFLTQLLGTQGVVPGKGGVPLGFARAAAWTAETLWGLLPLSGAPPITRTAVLLSGQEMTLSDTKARRELGYQGLVSLAEGLEELARSTYPPP